MNHPDLSVVIPAAGTSKRLGQAKQLIQHRGKSLILHAIEIARSLLPREIIVVTGAKAHAISDEIKHTGVKQVNNVDWAEGMGGSIATGIRSMQQDSTGVLILLCDQWAIRADDLQGIAETWHSNHSRIVAAHTSGRCGPPVIFPDSCFEELRDLKGDRGAHGVLNAHPDLLTPHAMKHAGFDLDTVEQLKQLQ